jgi:hypothetical protein
LSSLRWFRRQAAPVAALALSGVGLMGCASPLYYPQRTRYTYQISMTQPVETPRRHFIDADIDIRFRFLETKLAFHLHNNTVRPMTIDWDESRYIGEMGAVKRIIHKETKPRNRKRPQPPAVIPPSGFYDDHVLPSENILGSLRLPEILPLYPEWDYAATFYLSGNTPSADESADRRRAIAAGLNERTIGLDLAMIVNGRKKTYKFRFHVKVTRK